MQSHGRCEFRGWVSVSMTSLLLNRHTVSVKAADLTKRSKKQTKPTKTAVLNFSSLNFIPIFQFCFSCYLHNSAQKDTSLRK